MKRVLPLLATIAFLATSASANPLCLSDTIANYRANYTSLGTACQVGDKLFFAFNYSGTASNAVAPTSSEVTVVGDSTIPFEPGLVFSSSGWTVSGTATLSSPLYIDSNISFTVAVVGLLPLINDASLDFANHFSVSGQGVAVIAETVTPGSTSTSVSLDVESANGPSISVQHFAPVSFLRVSKDLIVLVPSAVVVTSGSASITQFREGFSEIPEPVSTVLFGSGLLGLAILRRRGYRITTPAADFCRPVRTNHLILSPVSRTNGRSPEVSSPTFRTQPPNLQPVPLMDRGFAVIGPLARHRMPQIRFLYIGSYVCSTHASFRRSLAVTPLR